MEQHEIDAIWAMRPKPNKVKATAYALIKVREFDKRSQSLVRNCRLSSLSEDELNT